MLIILTFKVVDAIFILRERTSKTTRTYYFRLARNINTLIYDLLYYSVLV